MAWTEADVELLKKLWAEGLSASEIAKRLDGVTRNAVIGKVHRLGLSGRRSPIARKPKPAPKPRRVPGYKGPTCQWPLGDPGDPDFGFCGGPAVPGRPYCEEHCAMAYVRKEARAA